MKTNQFQARHPDAAQSATASAGKSAKSGLLGRIDLKRSLAMSAVLITHTLVFGVMLLPSAPIAAIALPPPEVAWVEFNKAPPPPPKPPETPPVRLMPKVQPVVATRQPISPPIEASILVATTRELSPEMATPSVIAPTIVDPPATVSGNGSESILKVLRSPPPQFPPELVRAGFSGAVEFSVLVGVDGTAQEITLMKSSGNRKLDRSTLSHIKRYWRFKAPEQNGQAMPGWGRGRVTFTMEG